MEGSFVAQLGRRQPLSTEPPGNPGGFVFREDAVAETTKMRLTTTTTTTPQGAFAHLHEEYKEWAAARARALGPDLFGLKCRYEGSTSPALLDTLLADSVRMDLCVECLRPHNDCTC